MTTDQSPKPLNTFKFKGTSLPVSFDSTLDVTTGVQCDVYRFVDDSTKDLGIIRIERGYKTPLQRVLKGDRTIEGYISGKGKLTITKPDGKKEIFEFNGEKVEPFFKEILIGELMQWEADNESQLTAYEICFPPYEDGRYENLD